MSDGKDRNDERAERVCAVVVTYNRKDLLRECLLALFDQTRCVDRILVVNNASTDDTRRMLAEDFSSAEFSQISLLDLPENVGGAGGFHAGMKQAHEQGFDWLWLMDDDGRPATDCLAKLLAHSSPDSVMVPVQQDSSGRFYGVNAWRGELADVTTDVMRQQKPVSGEFTFAFVGPLIPRKIVDQIGLPNKDFFIWFDDHEYALRILSDKQSLVTVVPNAIFFHDFGKTKEVSFLGRKSLRSQQPAWKTYYGTRNQLYTVTRMRRKPREVLIYFVNQVSSLAGEVVFEDDWRQRVSMRLRGIRDGVLGRLGKRVEVK